MSFQRYRAEGRGQLPPFHRNEKLNDPALYRPSPELVNAVNVALALGQPLLLTGEPGTGKTQLAHHVAWFFDLGKPEVLNIQTSSTATDLFYRYDALGHFQYTQNNPQQLDDDTVEERYIRYRGLGAAIRARTRRVVLLDEIDKAPRDLPNDVLAAIEDLSFKVPEIGREYTTTPENRPVIIMTSNSEKNLPDPFLRRVVFYHIPFPDKATLLAIVSAKVDGFSPEQLTPIVDHFDHIRRDRSLKLRKQPATAELIFWAMVLTDLQFDPAKLPDFRKLNGEDKEKLVTSYSVLAKTKEDLQTLKEMLRG